MVTISETLGVDASTIDNQTLESLDQKLKILISNKKNGEPVRDESILLAFVENLAKSRQMKLSEASQRVDRMLHLGRMMTDYLGRQDPENPEVKWLTHAIGLSFEPPSAGAVLEAFKRDIFDQSDEIDPENERDWSDLAFGYALGKGCTQETAEEIGRRWVEACHNPLSLD